MLSITLSVVIASDDAILFAGASPACAVESAAPLDVVDLLDQISADPVTAATRLAALTPEQRYRQAIAHAAWCDAYDVPVAADVVAAAYARFMQAHLPPQVAAAATAERQCDRAACPELRSHHSDVSREARTYGSRDTRKGTL